MNHDLHTLIAAGESLTLEELAQEFQGFEPMLSPQLQRIPVAGGDEDGLTVLLVHVERAIIRWGIQAATGCGVDHLDSREIVVTLWSKNWSRCAVA